MIINYLLLIVVKFFADIISITFFSKLGCVPDYTHTFLINAIDKFMSFSE
jgi:hypothetical protein